MTDAEIRDAISRYKWYHVIRVTDDIATPGNPAYIPTQNVCLKYLRALDLRGKRVLDIGCSSGYLARPLVERGCTVVGIERDPVAGHDRAARDLQRDDRRAVGCLEADAGRERPASGKQLRGHSPHEVTERGRPGSGEGMGQPPVAS